MGVLGVQMRPNAVGSLGILQVTGAEQGRWSRAPDGRRVAGKQGIFATVVSFETEFQGICSPNYGWNGKDRKEIMHHLLALFIYRENSVHFGKDLTRGHVGSFKLKNDGGSINSLAARRRQHHGTPHDTSGGTTLVAQAST